VRFTLLGTGCPVVSPRRYGPAQLVEAGGVRLLIDCGSGVTQRLIEAGTKGSELDALLVTHLHTDHVVDLWQLVVSGWHQGRSRPLRVIAPLGFKHFTDRLILAWAEERAQRLAFERRPNADGFALDVEEIRPGERRRFAGIEVEAVAVDHRPVEPALGFVFSDGRHRLVLSGDTRPCPALVEAARDCDVLVHEVFVHDALRPSAGIRSAETIAAVASYHTRSGEVGRIATEARARSLVLTHLVPPDADPLALLQEVRQDYAGPTLVGEDLMRLDLERGTLEWRGAALGLGR
jgi:ribonuclease Z